jgi:hypothetical protein
MGNAGAQLQQDDLDGMGARLAEAGQVGQVLVEDLEAELARLEAETKALMREPQEEGPAEGLVDQGAGQQVGQQV